MIRDRIRQRIKQKTDRTKNDRTNIQRTHKIRTKERTDEGQLAYKRVEEIERTGGQRPVTDERIISLINECAHSFLKNLFKKSLLKNMGICLPTCGGSL